MTPKSLVRQRLRQARQALTGAARAAAEARMNGALLDVARDAGARVVAVYAAAGSEADPGPFAASWRASGGVTAYPRVVPPDTLTFWAVAGPEALQAGYRGILEPVPAAPAVAVGDLDLIVVPGLGFTADGHRLGQGGGFYDRLLADPARRALTVGFAFAGQVVSALPLDPHDIALDLIVTEDGVARGGVWQG
ncbi:MAG: 5-formyltetrahydrofolate cyclo-ligase [Deltaproteobacteria bacterium]|nr:MAG: 5-formyltetrahydrofolate cyclo-ligase [Deltaproteobacteria bacterium]